MTPPARFCYPLAPCPAPTRRTTVVGLAYHVLNRRALGLPLFDAPADYAAFDRCLARAAHPPRRPVIAVR